MKVRPPIILLILLLLLCLLWLGQRSNGQDAALNQGTLSPADEEPSGENTKASLPLDERAPRLAEATAPGADVAREIPERFVLPEFKVGMTPAEILAIYWGDQWPEIEAALRGNGHGRSLDSPNTRDFSTGRPLGTIEDFFVGLEARALAYFDQFQGQLLFMVPGVMGATYLTPELLLDAVLDSKQYNPSKKELDANARLSLQGLIEESSLLPTLRAGDLDARWKQLIREDVYRIVNYLEPIHGRSFISPIMAMGEFSKPLVADTGSYPVFDINLPHHDWQDYPNEGGFFMGYLTIWAGSDNTLRYLYDEIRELNLKFQTDVQAFIAAMN